MNRALILGIGGQDGSYLADILLEKGYTVHGMYRRSSVDNLRRIAHCKDRITLHQGDMLDVNSVQRILQDTKPDEIYNEADQDHVGFSYRTPGYSVSITASAVANLLESVLNYCPSARVFQPCSATMFGSARPPQDENTPFAPASPYACAKVAAYYLARYYREYHGLFVSTAILYNHESKRRGDGYLLQKIIRGVSRIRNGSQEVLCLSNMDMQVDIGIAREYMEIAWLMLQQNTPDDFVIGTGKGVSIKSLATLACDIAGIPQTSVVESDEEIVKSSLIADTTKLRSILRISPMLSAKDALRYLLEWNLSI